MDRMSFIPGAQAREEIENANNLIYFRRDTALAYADEFLLKKMHPDYQILYQTMMACMSEGDQVDITWSFQEHPQGIEAEGEGTTKAVLKEASGKERVLWDASRHTAGLTDEQLTRAYNAYRDALAIYHNESQVPPRIPIDWSHWKGNQSISRIFSPSNILKTSGTTWYFVDFSVPFSSSSDIPMSWLSRPMRAFDALILTSILTIVYGVPPLVFGVRQNNSRLGKMPQKFRKLKYSYGDGTLDDDETDAFIVG